MGFVPTKFCRKAVSLITLDVTIFAKMCIVIDLSLLYFSDCFEITGPDQLYNHSTGPDHSASYVLNWNNSVMQCDSFIK